MSDINALPIKRTVAYFGGQNGMARALGIRQSTVWGWCSANRVPSKRIPEVIAAAARLDPPVHLRLDDFFDIPEPGYPSAATTGSGSQNSPAEAAP